MKEKKNTPAVSCIILAGGKSVRLGRDKRTEILGGQSLMERVITRLSSLSEEFILVTAPEQSTVISSKVSFKVVQDILPGKGPLGGIYTGLLASGNTYNLVVACDMPFLNQPLLSYMLGLAPGVEVVVPRIGDYHEPLHAVYSKDCMPVIKDLLERNDLSILKLFEQVRVRYVEVDEIDRFDPEHLSFFNINTKSDLDKAAKLVERETGDVNR
ncbi:MAG: molybdenum cofactor guanylyltransferase [Chloroflexi bacterium]|nr:molybdenum cofactor guanylyltransferase [Chloroflexota bacterium]